MAVTKLIHYIGIVSQFLSFSTHMLHKYVLDGKIPYITSAEHDNRDLSGYHSKRNDHQKVFT